MTTAIVQYNAGNTFSVRNVLERLGAEYVITDDPSTLQAASRVIVPGVGEARSAMRYLRERKLDITISQLSQPVLGICLGFQILCGYSEEGETECLGILSGRVSKFSVARKVPHIGWSQLALFPHPLWEGLPQVPYVYFVHSYYVPATGESIALCSYGEEFSAASSSNNFIGLQFHPEKSGDVGEQIIKNFLEWRV